MAGISENEKLSAARRLLEECGESAEHQCFRLKPEIDRRQIWYEGWILEVRESTVVFLPAPSPFDEADVNLFAEIEIKIDEIDLTTLK